MVSSIATLSGDSAAAAKTWRIDCARRGTASGRDGHSPMDRELPGDGFRKRANLPPAGNRVVNLCSNQNRSRSDPGTAGDFRPHNPHDC